MRPHGTVERLRSKIVESQPFQRRNTPSRQNPKGQNGEKQAQESTVECGNHAEISSCKLPVADLL